MQRRIFGGIVFDKDGVLADSEPINLQSAFQIFAEHRFPLEADAAVEIVGKHPADYLPLLAGRWGIAADEQARMLAEKNLLYDALWAEHGRLFDGARDVLVAAQGTGLRMGIATSSTAAELGEFLRRFELAGFFEAALSREDVARAKPDPAIYLAAGRRLRLPPDRLIVVEDSEYGIRSARAAGTFCVAVRSAHLGLARVGDADAHIDSIAELPRLLAELVGR